MQARITRNRSYGVLCNRQTNPFFGKDLLRCPFFFVPFLWELFTRKLLAAEVNPYSSFLLLTPRIPESYKPKRTTQQGKQLLPSIPTVALLSYGLYGLDTLHRHQNIWTFDHPCIASSFTTKLLISYYVPNSMQVTWAQTRLGRPQPLTAPLSIAFPLRWSMFEENATTQAKQGLNQNLTRERVSDP